jgi:hypothetical protein
MACEMQKAEGMDEPAMSKPFGGEFDRDRAQWTSPDSTLSGFLGTYYYTRLD